MTGDKSPFLFNSLSAETSGLSARDLAKEITFGDIETLMLRWMCEMICSRDIPFKLVLVSTAD